MHFDWFYLILTFIIFIILRILYRLIYKIRKAPVPDIMPRYISYFIFFLSWLFASLIVLNI